METELKHIFIHHINSESNEVCLEFQLGCEPNESCYNFRRPVEEKLNVLFKKISSKITTVKYRKCSKKIKNQPIIECCEIKAFDLSLNAIRSEDLVIKDLLSQNIILRINDDLYDICVNPLWIYHCQLPKVAMVSCPLYPILEGQNVEFDQLTFIWSIGSAKNDNQWMQVHEGALFIPTYEHLQLYIKLQVISPLNIKSQKFSIISTSPVQACPQTDYQLAMSLERTQISPHENTFRLCTYNILSNIYACTKEAKNKLYRHCDPTYLHHDYRQCLIFNEMFQTQPDIILLQEVDQLFFIRTLKPVMKYKSYQGIFQSKSKMNLEGQAIFWNSEKFDFVENISIPCLSSTTDDNNNELSATIESVLSQSKSLLERWKLLGQCMTGCVLESKSHKKNKLVISNNHLFYHPNYEVLRLFQVAIILNHIKQVKNRYNCAACIVAGDFNASYEDESIEFIFDSCSEFEFGDKSFELKHEFKKLSSAFIDVLEFSNFTPDYVGLLDHVIFEDELLVVKKAFGVPSRSDILQNVALPNKYHPSDHLPLFCDMMFL